MRKQGDFYPELLVNMISVAEQSGGLPEVLKALSEHYEHLLQMRKNFVRLIAWPVFQFIVAILVIALMILILGTDRQWSRWAADRYSGAGLVRSKWCDDLVDMYVRFDFCSVYCLSGIGPFIWRETLLSSSVSENPSHWWLYAFGLRLPDFPGHLP